MGGSLHQIYQTKTRSLKRYYSVLALLGLGLVAVELFLPLFSKLLFDYAYIKKEVSALNLIVSALLMFHVIQFAIRTCVDFLSLHIHQRISFYLRTEIYSHIQKLQMRIFGAQSKGDLIIRLTDDIDRIHDLAFTQ